jgi:hypothetical protein
VSCLSTTATTGYFFRCPYDITFEILGEAKYCDYTNNIKMPAYQDPTSNMNLGLPIMKSSIQHAHTTKNHTNTSSTNSKFRSYVESNNEKKQKNKSYFQSIKQGSNLLANF